MSRWPFHPQVHAARLHSGEDEVDNIPRLKVRELVRRNLDVMYALTRLAERWWPESRRLRPVDIVAEYDKTIINELDLLREAANAAQLRRNWLGSPLIYVPQVYFDYCRKSVMVMERIHGIPIDDLEALNAAGVNIPRLAANGVEIFFTQVFRDNFFMPTCIPATFSWMPPISSTRVMQPWTSASSAASVNATAAIWPATTWLSV